MDCGELERLLSKRSMTGLTPEQLEAVASHIESCEACSESWGRDATAQTLHAAAGRVPARPSTPDRVTAKVDGRTGMGGTGEPGAPEPGREHIEGFEILGRLGRGGMGTVFKARQVKLDRVVALKVMAPQLAHDESFAQRFVREAHAAAAVSHPNIVQVYDIGEDGDTHYIAMEFVEGESLKDVIDREGRVRWSRACEIMKQVAMALAEAHDAGILHRDVKPSNILLTKRGVVKIADFGLAKHPGVDVSVTEAGQAIGTALYLPPEAARGQPLDVRSDLYSLGATFYHALAGRPPFEGRTSVELALKHVQEEVPPLGLTAPDVPLSLQRMLHRLLSKDPDERYQSAHHVLDALKGVEMQIEQSRSTRAWPAQCSVSSSGWRRWARQHWRLAALVGGAAALVAALLVAVPWEGPESAPGPRADPGPPNVTAWVYPFDGKTLQGWKVVKDFPDGGTGADVHVEGDRIVIEKGDPWSGVAWTGDPPRVDYEIELQAMRVTGLDCFCMLVCPIRESHFVLNIGGWGGSTVGLELVDEQYGDRNLTTRTMSFQTGRWYPVRVCVTQLKIEAWVDDEKVIDLLTAGHVLTPSGYGACLQPLGLGAAVTKAALRNIRFRRLTGGEP